MKQEEKDIGIGLLFLLLWFLRRFIWPPIVIPPEPKPKPKDNDKKPPDPTPGPSPDPETLPDPTPDPIIDPLPTPDPIIDPDPEPTPGPIIVDPLPDPIPEPIPSPFFDPEKYPELYEDPYAKYPKPTPPPLEVPIPEISPWTKISLGGSITPQEFAELEALGFDIVMTGVTPILLTGATGISATALATLSPWLLSLLVGALGTATPVVAEPEPSPQRVVRGYPDLPVGAISEPDPVPDPIPDVKKEILETVPSGTQGIWKQIIGGFQ